MRGTGQTALAEFAAAPSSVREAFWEALRGELRAERDFDTWLAAIEAPGPPPEHPETTLARDRVRWGPNWNRRARAIRRAAIAPREDWTPSREDDPLMLIPARTYVAALTGEEAGLGNISCPLPDHDDIVPSFRVYSGGGWRCFGCGRSGTIYDLAAALWDTETRGQAFVELHKRLRATFMV